MQILEKVDSKAIAKDVRVSDTIDKVASHEQSILHDRERLIPDGKQLEGGHVLLDQIIQNEPLFCLMLCLITREGVRGTPEGMGRAITGVWEPLPLTLPDRDRGRVLHLALNLHWTKQCSPSLSAGR